MLRRLRSIGSRLAALFTRTRRERDLAVVRRCQVRWSEAPPVDRSAPPGVLARSWPAATPAPAPGDTDERRWISGADLEQQALQYYFPSIAFRITLAATQ